MNSLCLSLLSIFSMSSVKEPLPEVRAPKIACVYLLESFDFKKIYTDLVEVIRRPDIDGVLLVIDNGGGDFAKFSVIGDLIKKASTKKPVVSLVAGCAMSGGYMLAAVSDYIITHSGSHVGSIGVARLIEKHANKKLSTDCSEADVDIELFKMGEFKTYSHPDSPQLSEEQREYVLSSLELIYKYFLDLVSTHRGLSKENYTEWAEAREFIAAKALELGLIDEIGTIFEAETKIRELIAKKNPDIAFETDIEYCFYNDNV